MPGPRSPQPWKKIAPRPLPVSRRRRRRADRSVRRPRHTDPILLLLASLLSGCAPGAAPSGTGRGPLPPPQAVGYVWGNQGLAVDVAGAWLHNRGYETVETERARQVLAAASVTLTGSTDDQASLVRLAPELGAGFLVQVEATVMPLTFRRPATDGANPHMDPKQSLYRVQVVVRGIDARDGSVAWKGEARHRYPVSDANQALVELTQRALAQAFGE